MSMSSMIRPIQTDVEKMLGVGSAEMIMITSASTSGPISPHLIKLKLFSEPAPDKILTEIGERDEIP